MLRSLPQISQVTELFDSSSIDSETGEKRERIQVTFGTNAGKKKQSKKDSTIKTTAFKRIFKTG